MILVTGGAGFIGSNLIKGLNENGISDICIIDDLKDNRKLSNISSLDFSDYIDKSAFMKKISIFEGKNIEAVFHQGACTDTMEYDGRYMMENNYEYSKNLLHFCMENRTRLLYASSAAVYGSGEEGFREERQCENPLNIYAFSKLLFDRYVRNHLDEAPAQVVGLRYFNAFGSPEQHKGKMASVVLQFYNQARQKGRIELFQGSKDFRRDFIYVKDIVRVNLFFFNNPDLSGIYNCGRGECESFFKIADIVKESFDDAEIELIPFPPQLRQKYQRLTKADLTSLRKAGYNRSFTPVEEGVREYISILRRSDA